MCLFPMKISLSADLCERYDFNESFYYFYKNLLQACFYIWELRIGFIHPTLIVKRM